MITQIISNPQFMWSSNIRAAKNADIIYAKYAYNKCCIFNFRLQLVFYQSLFPSFPFILTEDTIKETT